MRKKRARCGQHTLRSNKVKRPVRSPAGDAQELGHPEELLQVGDVLPRDPVQAIAGGDQQQHRSPSLRLQRCRRRSQDGVRGR